MKKLPKGIIAFNRTIDNLLHSSNYDKLLQLLEDERTFERTIDRLEFLSRFALPFEEKLLFIENIIEEIKYKYPERWI